MTQVFAIVALLLDGLTTWMALARGGREVLSPVFKNTNGFIALNIALLWLMFWKLDYPEAWAAYGGVHLLAALWNGYQLWRTR